jgi:uncharacterized protein
VALSLVKIETSAMPPRFDEERCAEHKKFLAIDAAFRAGDLEALRAAVDDPDSIPNTRLPIDIGTCLEYAIYHSPLPFIRQLLELGANVTPPSSEHAGFPPLLAALSCIRSIPGSQGRPDVPAIIQVLLQFGADPAQRGINDYTALHMAVAVQDKRSVELLLAAGADPRLRTTIDDCETPLEMARAAGLHDIAAILESAENTLY